VFRARDARHDRHVAVKVLRQGVAASIAGDRFLREIQITARLHHPHCLTLIDSGEWNGAPFFVMPFVDGPSLRKLLDAEGRVPASRVAGLLRDVASALAAAHAIGIVHRDVKPENVLLSGPHAWVTDFGVARALGDAADARATSIGSAIGTPEYMAPEQCTGATDVDHRADICALGVVAYELLSGRSPFSRDSVRAILAAHLTAEPGG
jgi:serine/threonine protein kinase